MTTSTWLRSALSGLVAGACATVGWSQYTLQLASLNNEQAPANQASAGPFLSSEGRYVAFHSTANNIEPNPLGFAAVYVRDRASATTSRASFAIGGGMPNDACSARGISRDGRYVLFESLATNLLATDANGAHVDCFVYDRALATTTLVSRSTAGVQANSASTVSALSGNGRRAAFMSYATNLDPQHTSFGPPDVYVRDLDAQSTVLVSVNDLGVAGNGVSGYGGVAASFDGSVIAFTSQATNLVPGDTNARDDVFVRDFAQGTTSRVSVATGGAQSVGTAGEPSISGDGRFVAFSSDATDLVAQPMVPVYFRIYVHDRANGATTLATRAIDGSAGTGWAPVIADDGRRIAFLSAATNLVFGDVNGKADLFVHDRALGTTRLASITSSGTQANYRVDFSALSGDGRVAGFATLAWNLYPNDVNAMDVFVSLSPSAPTAYCTAKVNSLGCTPAIGASGSPSASSPSAFLVGATNVLNQRPGLLFYGFAPSSAPFQGGTLCVQPPTRRTGLQDSGGNVLTDDCSGAYSLDFNARIQSAVDPELAAGATVCCQYWSRDAASPSTTGLTDALAFRIEP